MVQAENLSNKPRFCKGCVAVPLGVVAEVETVLTPFRGDLERHCLSPDQNLPQELRLLRVVAVEVDSDNFQQVEVGDEAEVMVKGPEISAEGVLNSVRRCTGPRVTRGLFGKHTTCGALNIVSVSEGQ